MNSSPFVGMFTLQLKSVGPPGFITPCSQQFADELSEEEGNIFLGSWCVWRQPCSCGVCGVPGGFSSALWEFVKILCEEHQPELRWSSLAPSVHRIVLQPCTTAWAWCCVCASFPIPTEPPSLSVLEILILCDQGRTCPPVNLPLQGEKSASCITFTSWHDLSLRALILFHALPNEQTPQDLFNPLFLCT